MNISERIIIAKNNIRDSHLDTYFGKKWFESVLKIDEKNRHPIFSYLTNKRVCNELSQHLHILELCCDKYKRIIKKLKTTESDNNFNAIRTEIEVLAYYYEIYDAKDIEYEPIIKKDGKPKNPDVKLTMEGNTYYVEILTIFEEIEDKKMNIIQDKIREKIEEIEQPFAIDIIFERQITDEEVNELIDYVKKLLEEKNYLNQSFNFKINNEKIVEISFRYSPDNKGYVGSMGGPVKLRTKDAIRPKNKILDKIENQLLKNKKNIVIINLYPGSWVHFSEIDDAFYGQKAILSVRPGESPLVRLRNGIIHHPLGKYISLIIAYENDYKVKTNKKFYFNPNAKNIIPKDLADKL